MIQFKNLSLARGARILVESASLQLHPGHKVGLTGANGAGKSSVFALLRGELHVASGDLEMPPQWVIAHVAQETPGLEIPAIEFVLDGDAELRAAEAGVGALFLGKLRHRYSRSRALVPLGLELGEHARSSLHLCASKSALAVPRVQAVEMW